MYLPHTALTDEVPKDISLSPNNLFVAARHICDLWEVYSTQLHSHTDTHPPHHVLQGFCRYPTDRLQAPGLQSMLTSALTDLSGDVFAGVPPVDTVVRRPTHFSSDVPETRSEPRTFVFTALLALRHRIVHTVNGNPQVGG